MIGVGLDLIEIERIRSVVARQGEAFLKRILHEREDGERVEHVAGLFAAKEAVMKAMGTGMAGAAFAEIEIVHTQAGQPSVRLHGETAERAAALGIGTWHLSITHTKTTAAAVAIAV